MIFKVIGTLHQSKIFVEKGNKVKFQKEIDNLKLRIAKGEIRGFYTETSSCSDDGYYHEARLHKLY